MADCTAYFRGAWMPFSQVLIDPLDRGFLVGDVVFDVARTFEGRSFRMREHVDRLYRSLKYVRIDPGLSPAEMERISEEVVTRNEVHRAPVGDYAVWQFVTRGPGRRAHWPGASSRRGASWSAWTSSPRPSASPPRQGARPFPPDNRQIASRAWARSATRSSASSIPTA
jgi:branched-chain amino acid aminotransferase